MLVVVGVIMAILVIVVIMALLVIVVIMAILVIVGVIMAILVIVVIVTFLVIVVVMAFLVIVVVMARKLYGCSAARSKYRFDELCNYAHMLCMRRVYLIIGVIREFGDNTKVAVAFRIQTQILADCVRFNLRNLRWQVAQLGLDEILLLGGGLRLEFQKNDMPDRCLCGVLVIVGVIVAFLVIVVMAFLVIVVIMAFLVIVVIMTVMIMAVPKRGGGQGQAQQNTYQSNHFRHS
jgi:hypothetical protein